MRSTYVSAVTALVAQTGTSAISHVPDTIAPFLACATFLAGTAVFCLIFIERVRTFRRNVADDSNEYIRKKAHDEALEKLQKSQDEKLDRLEEHLTRVDTFTASAIRELRDAQYTQQGKIDNQGKQLDTLLDRIEVIIGKNDGMIAAVARLEATVAFHGNKR